MKIIITRMTVLALTVAASASFASVAQFGNLLKRSEVQSPAQTCPMPADAKASDPCLMSQSAAIAFCSSQGAHLPTAREFVQLATSLGAAGLIETAFPDISFDDPRVQSEIQSHANHHEFPVYGYSKTLQVVVDFYYSEKGYRNPSPAGTRIDQVGVWTASIAPFFNDSTPDVGHHGQWDGVYTLNYNSGGSFGWATPNPQYTSYYSAVICAKDAQ